MDTLYLALNLFRRRKFEECANVCTNILQEEKQNQAAWVLKLRALTHQVAFDDIDVMETLAESAATNENPLTSTARPGTSLNAKKSQHDHTGVNRPMTQGRPTSGIVRLSRSGLTGSSGQNPATSRIQTGRILSRLGTASLHGDSQTFINAARLNLAQYAALPHLAKPLFDYLYFVQGDMKSALDLANQVQQYYSINRKENHGANYWRCAVGRCLIRLGLVRQVIQGTSEWFCNMVNIDGVLLIAKSYLIMDQPLAALEIYQRSLDQRFPNDVALLSGIARIQEDLNMMKESVATYKKILFCDPGNVEGVACIASHLFYSGQPEWALVLYRRLLQMGVHNAEVFCNIALCCLKTNQFDLVIPCIENALAMANGSLVADIWYNMGHIALSSGNFDLAQVCWKLTLMINTSHEEACNNLGVLALMSGKYEEGAFLLKAALSFDSGLAEAKTNLELMRSCRYGTEQLI